MKAKKILIGGEWRDAAESFAVKAPFTNEALAEVFPASTCETEEAIVAAEVASKKMRFPVGKAKFTRKTIRSKRHFCEV